MRRHPVGAPSKLKRQMYRRVDLSGTDQDVDVAVKSRSRGWIDELGQMEAFEE
jgi:hypothetical protein